MLTVKGGRATVKTAMTNKGYALAFSALIGLYFFSPSFATTLPPKDDHYTMQVNYLDHANEGLYEIQVNNKYNVVMTAVIDRVESDKDLGYVYAFDTETLAPRWRTQLPHQAFSLAQDRTNDKLFVGLVKNNALRLSRINIATGEVEKTGPRLQVQPEDFKGNEGIRHQVYVPLTNELFVVYSSTSSNETGGINSQRLLVVDPERLEVKSEVIGAFPDTGYALHFDENTNKLYTAGRFINEIDPISKKVTNQLQLDKATPPVGNILALAVDSKKNRIFAAQNIFRSEGESDGVYVLDLKDGTQKDFIRTGRGSISISYDPKRNNVYVTNFRDGSISVVNTENNEIKKAFNIGPLPNEIALDLEKDRLYVGLKEVYSSRSSTGDYVAGAKERLLKIQLPSAP